MEPSKRDADIIVVGGGPCGLFSALTASKLKANVIVCEEHNDIGIPTHCAGHVSISGLKELGLPLQPKIIENEIKGASLYSPGGYELVVEGRAPITYVINRRLFDKHLAAMAEGEGVQILLNSRVSSILRIKGEVKGVSVLRNGLKREGLSSSLVIDSEGCPAALLEREGLPSPKGPSMVYGVHAELDRADVNEGLVEVYIGSKYAPGFFAWIIPKRDGTAKVGLASKTGYVKKYFENFIRGHPIASKKLRGGKVRETSYHPIPLGGPIPKTYSGGLLIVGDAASQVKPTTGGGLVFGLLCSKIAGEVSGEALMKNCLSEGFLKKYEVLWKRRIGLELAAMKNIRAILNRIPDRKIDEMFKKTSKTGLEEILNNIGSIDFQLEALINLARNPRTLIAMLKMLLSLLL